MRTKRGTVKRQPDYVPATREAAQDSLATLAAPEPTGDAPDLTHGSVGYALRSLCPCEDCRVAKRGVPDPDA